MGKDKYKEVRGTVGSHPGGDLEHFFNRSSTAAQHWLESKMALVPPSPACSESALDSLAGFQTCNSPTGTQDRSSRCFKNHPNTSIGSEDGWNMEFQMRSLHSYMRSLPTKADFEQCVKPIEKQEITELKKGHWGLFWGYRKHHWGPPHRRTVPWRNTQ